MVSTESQSFSDSVLLMSAKEELHRGPQSVLDHEFSKFRLDGKPTEANARVWDYFIARAAEK